MQDVRLDDAGQYQCFAENKFGREEVDGKLIVRGECSMRMVFICALAGIQVYLCLRNIWNMCFYQWHWRCWKQNF